MRDLFGTESHSAEPSRRARMAKPAGTATPAVITVTARPRARSVRPDQPTAAPALDPAAAASFRALGAAVCLTFPAGIVWLVPNYTDEARPEISADDMAKLVFVHVTFPGVRISSFKTPHTNLQSSVPPEAPPPDARRSK
jgi:hypothetical protein